MTRDPLDGPHNCGGTGCRGKHDLPLYRVGQTCPHATAPAQGPFLIPFRSGSAYLDPYSQRAFAPDPDEYEPHNPEDGVWDWEG